MSFLKKTCMIFFTFGSLVAVDSHQRISKEDLIERLYDIGSIQFGNFVLKVTDGYITTPYYLDLRLIMSYPDLLQQVIHLLSDAAQGLQYDRVCGVPFAALPYSVGFSLQIKVPMVMTRQILKTYGTRRAVEGSYKEGDTILVIEDVIVSGASVLATVETLRDNGLMTQDVIVLCDRQQGAVKNLQQKGLRVHTLFTTSDVLSVLLERHKITQEIAEIIKDYIANNQCD